VGRSKLLNNEKGITLVEVLVAISLLTIVMFLGFSLFSSVKQLWSINVYDSDFKSRLNVTRSTINNQLSDPIEFYLANKNELRFKTFDGKYKSLLYKSDQQSIWIYESTSSESLTEFVYDDGTEITKYISAFSIDDENENPLTSTGKLTNKKLTLSISFQKKRTTANGDIVISEKPVEFPIESIY
jgi:Tfp pilus assembly protein FimT